jgi:hypothetical protein
MNIEIKWIFLNIIHTRLFFSGIGGTYNPRNLTYMTFLR